eukprot:m.2394 g.2394  ORF g.2394 m.2394 type:complete len:240 (+) comp8628_c0_seq1:662-1381(+)
MGVGLIISLLTVLLIIPSGRTACREWSFEMSEARERYGSANITCSGYTCYITCQKKYKFSPKQNITGRTLTVRFVCNGSTWISNKHMDDLQCIPIRCRARRRDPRFTMGWEHGDENGPRVEAEVIYTARPGYEIVGLNRANCKLKKDGNSAKLFPRSPNIRKIKICEKPKFEFGRIIDPASEKRDTVRTLKVRHEYALRCKKGFKLEKGSRRTFRCTKNGTIKYRRRRKPRCMPNNRSE